MSAASKVAQGASGSPAAGGGFDIVKMLLEGRAFFALVVIVIVFSILSPVYFSTANFLVMASHVAIYGLLAIGMLLVILTGGIDLSVGPVMALAGGLAAGLMLAAVLIPLLFGLIRGLERVLGTWEDRA